jgi:hypothetical protein
MDHNVFLNAIISPIQHVANTFGLKAAVWFVIIKWVSFLTAIASFKPKGGKK